MEPTPSILHADVDAFYASVEQRDDPRLRGRPVVVGAGVVLAASYEAKAFGVRTAMPGSRARRLCPDAVVVSPRMSVYSEASKALFEVFNDTTAMVEGLSIDEAFLAVGGLWRLWGSPVEIAMRLRRDVLDRVGLPVSVGVARTKFLAKVASSVAKPDGLLVVPPDRELAFLQPLPVERLWGVGAVTSRKLRLEGITTVAQVAQLGEAAVVRMVGQAVGRRLHALAHNRDPRPVEAGRRRRSIGAQRSIGRRSKSSASVDTILVGLVDRLARRLRAAHRVCRTIVLRLRFDDLSRATRSHTLSEATAQTELILSAARTLLIAAAPVIQSQGITLVGVSLTNLSNDSAIQLTPVRSAQPRRPRRSTRYPAQSVWNDGGHAGRASGAKSGSRGPAASRLSFHWGRGLQRTRRPVEPLALTVLRACLPRPRDMFEMLGAAGCRHLNGDGRLREQADQFDDHDRRWSDRRRRVVRGKGEA